jgi:hypothetical protein
MDMATAPFAAVQIAHALTFGTRAGAVHAIKWAVQRARYMTLETIAPWSDDPIVKLSAVAA